VAPLYAPAKAVPVEASNWGLPPAIGVLDLGISLPAIAALGWRQVVTMVGMTLVIPVA
jgi:hypothetical protein